MTRDYRSEFQDLIESAPLDGTTTTVVAAEIVAKLRNEDPELLAGWLGVNAEVFLTRFIGDQSRARRSREASDRPRSAFADAAERFEAGDQEPLQAIRSIFAETMPVNEEKVHRSIGAMTKADHRFVAGDYVKQSNALLFESAFHKAVARRIPAGKTTAEVMSEDAYLRLRESIRSPKKSAA